MLKGTTRARTLIVGSGLSGSLLVQALADARAPGVVTLVDTSDAPCRGRRWAAWETPDADVRSARRFRRLRVAGPEGEHLLELRDHVYTVRDGDDLDAGTDAALRRLGGRRRTTRVTSVDDDAGCATVHTESGPLQADLVLDSTGIGISPAAAPSAWLHFTGWRVSCVNAAFDPDTVTLMDFRIPQEGELRFVYVLPESADTALVELTTFSGSPEPAEAADDLCAYLDQLVAPGRWSILDQESGTLQLCPGRRPRGRGRRVLVGSAAGLVKASTGYGYDLMKRDAALLATDLAAGRAPRGLPRRRHHRWMDAVYLELAIADPATMVTAVERLFTRNPVDRVLRFLGEESTLREEAHLVRSLPTMPFLRAALRTIRPPRRDVIVPVSRRRRLAATRRERTSA